MEVSVEVSVFVYLFCWGLVAGSDIGNRGYLKGRWLGRPSSFPAQAVKSLGSVESGTNTTCPSHPAMFAPLPTPDFLCSLPMHMPVSALIPRWKSSSVMSIGSTQAGRFSPWTSTNMIVLDVPSKICEQPHLLPSDLICRWDSPEPTAQKSGFEILWDGWIVVSSYCHSPVTIT